MGLVEVFNGFNQFYAKSAHRHRNNNLHTKSIWGS